MIAPIQFIFGIYIKKMMLEKFKKYQRYVKYPILPSGIQNRRSAVVKRVEDISTIVLVNI